MTDTIIPTRATLLLQRAQLTKALTRWQIAHRIVGQLLQSQDKSYWYVPHHLAPFVTNYRAQAEADRLQQPEGPR